LSDPALRPEPSGERSRRPPVRPLGQRGEAGQVPVSTACCPGDLLVAGSGRRGMLARLIVGKVSRYCVTACPVPRQPASPRPHDAASNLDADTPAPLGHGPV